MTKISQYPTLSNPTEDDILIGTDVNSSDETKNFSIGSIIDLVDNGVRPYKVYTALLTKTTLGIFTANVLENTLTNETVTLVSPLPGSDFTVEVRFEGFEDENKVFFTITPKSSEGYLYVENDISINYIYQPALVAISITTSVGQGEFDFFDNLPIEIRVYN